MKLVYKSLLAAAVLLAMPAAAVAATDVSGKLSGDATWNAAGNPYQVGEDVTVPEGTVLTIEPGVKVSFQAGRSLVVEGTLIARGTAEDPVLFTGTVAGGVAARWGSIVFADSSLDAQFMAVDQYVSGSIVEECTFEWASNALYLESASPYIHKCTFRDNRTAFSIDIEGGGAIYVGPHSSPRIAECDFLDNFADGFNYGGAIYVYAADPVIQDNLFAGNVAIYGGAISTLLMAAPIVGNRFEDNHATGSSESKGGAVSLVSTVSPLIANHFESNSSEKDGGGLHVCVDCFPHATPFVIANTVVNNTCSNDDPADGAAGVGAAYLRAMYNNSLSGNLRQGKPSDFGWFHPLAEGYPEWVSKVSVAVNWWGTTDDDKIQATITDGTDVEGLGTCDHKPVLQDPPGQLAEPVVTITTRRLVYDEAGLSMPVFLTIYNPGAPVDVDLFLFVEYEGQSPIPYQGELDFPGAKRQGPGFGLTLPENAVYFTRLAEPEYVPGYTSAGHFVWRASLHNSDTGKRLMEASTSRSDLHEEVEP